MTESDASEGVHAAARRSPTRRLRIVRAVVRHARARIGDGLRRAIVPARLGHLHDLAARWRRLVLPRLRAALERVRRGRVAARLAPRIIAFSTLSPALKIALGASYGALLVLALMTAGHTLLETGAPFRLEGGIYMPLGVFLAGVPIFILVATLLMASAILANAVARWGAIVLLTVMVGLIASGAYPQPWTADSPAQFEVLSQAWAHALLQLELPVMLLIGIAIFRRRLPRRALLAGCLVAFLVLTALIGRFAEIGDPGFAGLAATMFVGQGVVFVLPAILVVGADVAEWTEILGESAAEALPPQSKRREWAYAAVAIALNAGVIAYWTIRLASGELEQGSVTSGGLALAAVTLAAGLGAIFAVLLLSRSRRSHGGHVGYLTILIWGCLIAGAPIVLSPFAEQDAPPPTQIFRLRSLTFSIDVPPGSESDVLKDTSRNELVRLTPAKTSGELLITSSHIDDKVEDLNSMIVAGKTFPPTALVLSAPDADGWMRFDATLVRYANMRHGWTNLGLQLVKAGIPARPGLPKSEGGQVTAVVPDSPAARAGIGGNDIVLAVDGHAVTGVDDLLRITEPLEIGTNVMLTVWRDGGTQEIAVTLAEQPEEQKPKVHFVIWKKSIAFEPGRTNVHYDSYNYLTGACSVRQLDDCMATLETMKKSWMPGVRSVPSWWGRLAIRLSWLVLAVAVCAAIPWFRRRSDARSAVALAALALVSFAYVGLRNSGGAYAITNFDATMVPWLLRAELLIVVIGSAAMLGWLAVRRRAHANGVHLLRLVTALNFTMLVLYNAFAALDYSSDTAEHSNIAKGLLVIAALTWEITASGSVTNIATRRLPRASRMLLFLAYVLLVADTVFILFPSRYLDMNLPAFNPEVYILKGIVLLGVPLIFAGFAIRMAGLLRRRNVPADQPPAAG
jgi:hypothetical protein